MDRYFAIREQAIRDAQAIATAMQPGASRIGNGFVGFNAQREIRLHEFVGDVGEAGPQRVPIRAVAGRSPGNAAEADLEQLEPFPVRVVTRVHQMR